MNLLDYFIADLPADASLTPLMLNEACLSLKRNREQYLRGRSTQSLIDIIAETAQGWLDPTSPFRQLALDEGPLRTGLPAHLIETGLDQFFRQVTSENLDALVRQDLGHRSRLDHFTAAESETAEKILARAQGPELIAHFTAGVIPNPTLLSLILGLLVRSAQFVKCARGSAFLPRLFAHSLYQLDPKLGACLELAEWPGGQRPDLERVLLCEADCVTATGNDATLRAIRGQLPVSKRFLGYGERVSFAYLTADASHHYNLPLIQAAADDVIAWNQLGCLSPHLFYVETGGRLPPAAFALQLAEELGRREATQPRGLLPAEQSAVIATRRDFYQVRAAHSAETLIWSSPHSTAWTVVFEENPLFQLSCLNRFVYVKAVTGVEGALHGADAVRGKVSTIGVAGSRDAIRRAAERWASWGATRICPIGQMQRPPLSWRHDGRPALGDLITWTNWEL